MARREPGIPTEHRHTRFRSRLEARWAAFFDAIGWRWEYEPFDVEGYVPDFAILGKRPLLVEVKPALTVDELREHLPKVERAGRDTLIVGATPVLTPSPLDALDAPGAGWSGYPIAGLLVQWIDLGQDCSSSDASWFRCLDCGQVAVYHRAGWWVGYPCGHYDGDGYIGPVTIPERAWADARNLTQWESA